MEAAWRPSPRYGAVVLNTLARQREEAQPPPLDKEWPRIFIDPKMITAPLDRLTRWVNTTPHAHHLL